MKYLLLFTIRIYWIIIPVSKRKICLFKESCSKYVYGITEDKGFIAGLNALRQRMCVCNSKYMIYKKNENFEMHLTDGSVLQRHEISLRLLPPHSYNYKNLNNQL